MTIVTNHNNHFDALEKIIFSNNLRIKTLDIHPALNIMNIVLNTGFVIRTNISSFPNLKKASKAKLLKYRLIGDGTGVHWPEIDEDLSLKGFLKDELLKVVKPDSVVIS